MRQILGVGLIGETRFGARANRDQGAISVVLRGHADVTAVPTLGPLLKDVHDEAIDAGIAEVSVDFRSLEFMNSSCFKCFVTWLNSLQQTETERQYKVRFVSDAAKAWQLRSLPALSAFAGDLVKIETTNAA